MDSHYGGFWRRLSAFSIDKLILAMIGFMMFILGSVAFGLGISPSDLAEEPEIFFALGMQVMVIYQAITIFLDMAYFTYFHGTTGQTPGKRLLGLRVVGDTGEAITIGTAFLRWVGLHHLLCAHVHGLPVGGRGPAQTGLARQDRRHRRDRPLPGRRGRDPAKKCLDKSGQFIYLRHSSKPMWVGSSAGRASD